MFRKKWVKLSFLALCAGSNISANQTASVELNYSFEDATNNEITHGQKTVALDLEQAASTDMIDKSLLLIDMATSMKTSIEEFYGACQDLTPLPPPLPRPIPYLPTQPIVPPTTVIPVVIEDPCSPIKAQARASLLSDISSFEQRLNQNLIFKNDEKLFERLDLFRKLADNMENYSYYPGIGFPERSHLDGSIGAIVGAPINVSSGGAMDFSFVKKTIEDGMVPYKDNIDIKGFLSDFDLSPQLSDCNAVICIEPFYKLDPQQKKLFVQIGMDSNVNDANFQRKDLNLSLVIDISGSMSATDNTEKSRLDWAKDAAIETVENLREGDYLSIIVFESESEIILPITKIASQESKEDIINTIKTLETKGSTNLYDGLRLGFESLSQQNFIDSNNDKESRVILISDAGLNTGFTELSTALKLVSDYASEGIGLTAIGLGENFNQEFILGISQSAGGNYIYVHSGRDMYRYFQEFKFLVSPVAYKLKAFLTLNDMKASLKESYGLPKINDAQKSEFINVQTLFLTKGGGGTMILEYDLQ
ncbi:MAG: VWA domain-containing protein [Myxococcales bacterium]|nr:VWA domain-containing protein [Myxococcales bacterium]USN51599.1 MAG: VWA domain-containing protein [Myxococcales bacterium]